MSGPHLVAVGLSALLASIPAPGGDRAVLVAWLARKADLFDRVALASCDPRLSAEAAACAADTRHTIATLTAPRVPGTRTRTSARVPLGDRAEVGW